MGNNINKTESLMSDLLDSIDATDTIVTNDDNYFIKDREEANRYVKYYKKRAKELEDIEATAQKAIDEYTQKVEAWKDDQERSIKSAMEYYESKLRMFAENELQGSKKRSLKFIEGTVQFRTNKPVLNYSDEDTLINYFKENNSEYVVSTPKLNKNLIKTNISIEGNDVYLNGHKLPFVSVTYKEDSFTIK